MEAILAIETSVPEASVALWVDGRRVFEEDFVSDRNHNSMVFDPLARALGVLNGLDGGRLLAVLVGTGPGSYSGTRIGIAAAQGVALVHGAQAVGLGSLAATREALAGGRSVAAVGDARRGMYFVSEIGESGEAGEAELMDIDGFGRRLEEMDGEGDLEKAVLFTLDDPGRLPTGGRSVVRARPEARYLIDVWLGLSEERRGELAGRALSPTYLRAPFTSKAKPGHPLLRKV